jgi:hypothetical protein
MGPAGAEVQANYFPGSGGGGGGGGSSRAAVVASMTGGGIGWGASSRVGGAAAPHVAVPAAMELPATGGGVVPLSPHTRPPLGVGGVALTTGRTGEWTLQPVGKGESEGRGL